MMIDLFSSSVRGGYANAATGNPQSAPGNGVFGAILGVSTERRPGSESVVVSADLPNNDEAQEDDAAVIAAQDQAEPQDASAGQSDEGKRTPETHSIDATPDLDGANDNDFLPTSQLLMSEDTPKAPRDTPPPAAAATNNAPKQEAADTRQVQTGAVDRFANTDRQEVREMAQMGAVLARRSEASTFARSEPVDERGFPLKPEPTADKKTEPMPSSVGATSTLPGNRQSHPARASDMSNTTGAAGPDDDENARLARSIAATLSAVDISDQGVHNSRISKMAPVSPQSYHPVSLVTARAVTEAGAASDTIPPSVPISPSRFPIDQQPAAALSKQGAGSTASATSTDTTPPTGDRPLPAPLSAGGFFQQSTGHAAIDTTTDTRPSAGDRPLPAPQPAADLSQRSTNFAPRAKTTDTMPSVGDRPPPAPTEPTRPSANLLRWVVDPPPSDSARWAPLPPGAGPIAPLLKATPFAVTTSITGSGVHEAPGDRLEKGEVRTTLQAGDGQVPLSSGASVFVSRFENGTSSPRTAAELARDTAQQIAAQVLNLGKGRFELSLSPNELGKVDMMLQDSENRLTLIVNAERPETMDLIRRHITLLELELRQMGLGNLSLQLGTGGAPGSQGGQGRESRNSAEGSDIVSESVSPADRPTVNPLSAGDHLDLRL